MTLALPHPMTIKPEDFEPPLKRKEPSVPGYWTVEELAEELGVTVRYVQYLIKGKPKENKPPQINAYKAGFTYLVADTDALECIEKSRQSKKSI
jgi:transcriptional regulator with XRE-family HTH domain